MSTLKLLTDQALGETGSKGTDGLGFDTYAQILSSAAVNTLGPFTVGIFGEWGTGKTSLMKMIATSLSSRADVITVWFNAWRFEKEEHPIVPLVASIVRELERNKSFLNRLTDGGRTLLRSLRAVAYGFSAKSTVKVPGFAEIEASFVAKDMIDRDENIRPDPLLDRSLYYEAFETLANVRLGAHGKIVVIVDDLDRCFPDLAIKLLESIKLVLSQEGFVFILGVARSVVEGYLNYRYKEQYGLNEFDGASYLDKIVQLPFYIPPHRGRMEAYLDNLLNQLDPEVQGEFENLKPIIGAASGANPRATKRFMNNLLIDRAINEELSREEKPSHIRMELIPISYFAVSRSLQQRWRGIFSQIVTSPELCERISEWNKASLSQYANVDDQDLSALATTLLGDRSLADLLFSKEGRAWLRDTHIRMATIEFLREKRIEDVDDRAKPPAEFDIFISYNSSDQEPVSRIADILSKVGIRFFIDREQIQIGDVWSEKIEQALMKSKAVMVCLGSQSADSKWQREEIMSAMRAQGVKIIPVLLPGAATESIPDFLKTRMWLDLRNNDISKEKLKPLVSALM